MASTRRTIRRITLGTLGAAGSLLAIPAVAGAVVYCVPNDAIDPSCDPGQGHATIQSALTAAAGSTSVADTVRVGAGNYSEASLNYASVAPANVLTLVGAGTDQTLLSLPDTTGNKTGLQVQAPAGSTVSGLAMTIPANVDTGGDIGIHLVDTAGQNLLVDGPSATNARGFQLAGSATIDASTVDLPFAVPSNFAVSGGNNTVVTDSNLHANTGIRYGTVERSTITASTAGASLDSLTVTVRNSVIDLGANIGAVGVQLANFNHSTSSLTAVVDGATIVGGGTNSTGIQALADSDATVPINEPGDTTNDGETATATVSNTVISGPTRAFRVEADRGEVATVSSSYSNYNPAANVVTSDLTVGGGTGTATLNETNQTNLATGFVSATDFHLAPGSSLIDIGDPAAPGGGAVDIDGDPRAIDGGNDCVSRRDIGADETLAVAPTAAFTSGPAEGSTINNSTPTFTFTSSRACAPSFQCSLDGAAFAGCGSPHTMGVLPDGSHSLAIRALGEFGDPGPGVAVGFRIDRTAPDTTVSGKRKVFTRKKKVRVTETLSSTEPGSSFECSVDSRPFVPCTSPFSIKLRIGKHLLTVRSTDALGNQDATPASAPVRIGRKR